MKRAAVYLRVSTKDKGQSTNLQLNDLKTWAKLKNFNIVRVFEDVGISGAKTKRPALDEIMSEVEKGSFDAVLVWKFDRFARNTRYLLKSLEYFEQNNVDFLSFSENIDTSTPTGKMVFAVIGALSQFERDTTSERVKAGLREAKRNGRVGGKKPADKAKILKLHGLGYDKKQIQAQTGYSRWTVNRTLKEA